jgi:hypothetical protein
LKYQTSNASEPINRNFYSHIYLFDSLVNLMFKSDCAIYQSVPDRQ